MTELRQWREALLAELDGRLADRGYRRRRRDQDWTRASSVGRNAVHVSFINHPPRDFDVTLDVAVRLSVVEDAVEACGAEAKPGQRYTLGAEVGNLTEGAPRRWTVREERDIAVVAGEIERRVDTVAEPYFERFADLATALDVLASDEREVWLHSPFHMERAIRAVALCVAVRGPQEAAELAIRKRAFLESAKDPMRARFVRVAECLIGERADKW